MGLFYLLGAMTFVVAIALCTVINRVYKPKHVPAPLPPKDRKRKKGKKGKSGGGKGFKTKFVPIHVEPDENVPEEDAEELEDEMMVQTGTTGQLTLTPNGESMNGTTAVNTPKKTNSSPDGELDRMSPAVHVDTKSSSIPNGELENQMATAKVSRQPAATATDGLESQAPVANASTQTTASASKESATTVSKQPASTSPDESHYHTPENGTPNQVLSTPGKKSRKKKARHLPLAPPSQSSATRASDDIETPTHTTHPIPAAEFIPLFSLAEPGNVDQTVSPPTLHSLHPSTPNHSSTS